MTPENVKGTDERVLVVAPTGRDAEMIARILGRAGVATETCRDVTELCSRADAGAGTLVVAEEAAAGPNLACLEELLMRQAVWSDLPLLILTGGGKTTRFSTRVAERLHARGNITLLERPLRILTLVSAVRSSLRARRRQYEVRNLLEQKQQAIRQRDQFLAMLGHELRNPLAAIRTAIEVVNQSGVVGGPLLDEQAQIITRQSNNVTRLVDDLLDVARVTSGKISLDRRPVDLREVATRALKTLRLSTAVQKHEIQLKSHDQPLMIDADDVRLEQVTLNLLTNAVKYTPPGGTVCVSLSREGNDAVLRVRDTGGIPSHVLPHVFEPFVQSEQQIARVAGGLGIGLTVVRALVGMHCGEVTAASEGPDRGSEFTVRLPLTLTHGATAPRANGDDTVKKVSRRVLLVEDNDDARRAMERLLKLWGHRAEVASDGSAGVRLALALRPEVMLVDIGLPDIDGYEVARRVRQDLGHSVYVVALTGYGQPEDRDRAHDAGFDLHLVKPVAPQQLRQILASVDAKNAEATPQHA